MLNDQAEETENPERRPRTSDQRDEKQREEGEVLRRMDLLPVSCYREVRTEDLSDFASLSKNLA